MSELVMEEQIKLLIELQGLDKEIFKFEKDLAQAPEQIKSLDAEYKQKEEEVKAKDTELKQVQVAHKTKEIELKTKEDSIKKLEGQLYQLKTNKEYTAMENEIKGVKADCSLLEEEIITLLDKIDEAENQKKQRSEELKVEQKKTEDEKKRISEEIKKEQESLNQIKTQRNTLAEKVDKNILSKYERILHNREGMALVPVRGNACQGCFLNLPPQVINEIKMKEDFVFCESCARILYMEE